MDDSKNQNPNDGGDLMARMQGLLDDSKNDRKEAEKKIGDLEKQTDTALRLAETAALKIDDAQKKSEEEVDELVLEELASEE